MRPREQNCRFRHFPRRKASFKPGEDMQNPFAGPTYSSMDRNKLDLQSNVHIFNLIQIKRPKRRSVAIQSTVVVSLRQQVTLYPRCSFTGGLTRNSSITAKPPPTQAYSLHELLSCITHTPRDSISLRINKHVDSFVEIFLVIDWHTGPKWFST